MARSLVLLCLMFSSGLIEVWCAVPSLVKRGKPLLSSHDGKGLQPSKESIGELAVKLAKQELTKLIIAKHKELNNAAESIHNLQQDSCSNIKEVGKPVTHNSQLQTQGAWMKDPLGIMGTETIFVMEGYSGRKIVQVYKNMEMYKAGLIDKTHTLPHNWDGTGAVVYGPFLFYNKENSNVIVKYDLRKEKVEKETAFGAYPVRKNHYQWGGNTGMDFAVDEQGLWLIYGSTANSYKLYVSKLNILTLTAIQTWTLPSESMRTMGNAFVACGVIYCIDSYNAKSTTINFAYDTKTHKHWNPNIQFTNQYGYNSMVDYNPREKLLYAWDHKRQVTYSLTFETEHKE